MNFKSQIIKIILLLMFSSSILKAQSFSIRPHTLFYDDYMGLKIVFAPKFSSSLGSTGFGSARYTLTLNSLGVGSGQFSYPTEINYKGKVYYMNSFNSELRPFFERIRITAVNVYTETVGLKDCKELNGNFIKEGESFSRPCISEQDNVEIIIKSIKVASAEGVIDLQKKIDQLENSVKTQNQDNLTQKNELNNQESNINTTNSNNLNSSARNSSNTYQTQNSNNDQLRSNAYNQINSAEEQSIREKERQLQEMRNQYQIASQNRTALNNASDETTRQWAQGNYIEGSRALANEFARQGNLNGAVGVVGVGTALQIFSVLSENKKSSQEAERIREEERLRLEEEKRKIYELEQAEIRRKDLLENIRAEVVGLFPLKSIPTSISNIGTNKIFYFVYTNIQDPREDVQNIYVSNVFALGQYPDGTWPLQKTLETEISKLTNNITPQFCGYFLDEKSAQNAFEKFKSEMNSAFVSTQQFNYSGKNQNIEQVSVNENKQKLDFWGNPLQSGTELKTLPANIDSIKKEKKVKLDYWGNPIKEN